jgi:hypothetical protein
MKRNLLLGVLAAALIGAANPAWGDAYVIAVPVGIGTPIASLPYTITQPGFYYLKKNLSTTGTDYAITVDTSEVTLDLMGFSLTGPSPAAPPGAEGIHINAGLKNVEVRNGQIKNFYRGINSPPGGSNHRLANLRVSGCSFGISCYAESSVITGCQATGNTTGISSGASGAVMEQNTTSGNTSYGFYLFDFRGVITNNAAKGNGTGFYLGGNPGQLVDRNSSVANTTANWANLSGCTAGLNTPP